MLCMWPCELFMSVSCVATLLLLMLCYVLISYIYIYCVIVISDVLYYMMLYVKSYSL